MHHALRPRMVLIMQTLQRSRPNSISSLLIITHYSDGTRLHLPGINLGVPVVLSAVLCFSNTVAVGFLRSTGRGGLSECQMISVPKLKSGLEGSALHEPQLSPHSRDPVI
jgi:hypothetical protein